MWENIDFYPLKYAKSLNFKVGLAYLISVSSMLSALGCSVDVQPIGATEKPQDKTESGPQTFKASGLLNLASSNQSLASVGSNALTVRGVGSQAKYELEYKFGSGRSNKFKVIRVASISKAVGCSIAPVTKTTLISKDGEVVVDLNQTMLKPNTYYVLKFLIEPGNCAEYETTFDPLVWADEVYSVVEPMLANACQGNKSGEIIFFRQLNLITAFRNWGGGDKFLSDEVFCGEKLAGRRSGGMKLTAGVGDVYNVEGHYQSLYDLNEFSFFARAKQNAADLTCTKNGVVVHSEQFTNCVESVKSLTWYRR